jgi:CRP/FNR family cyclic AMP-dependent transcriptional regulator
VGRSETVCFQVRGTSRANGGNEVDSSKQSLRGLSLLDGLPDDALRSIEKSCNWKIYSRDEQILDRVSGSRDVYFVVTGEV